MLSRNHLDRIRIAFDDHRVANAGLLLPGTLALHLGLSQLVQERLDLGDAPGRANTGDKIMTLVASALAGGRLHRRRRRDAHRGDGRHPGARSRRHPRWAPRASFRWGHVRPAGPGEPRVAGTSSGRPKRRTWREAIYHRPSIRPSRDLRRGQRGWPPPRLPASGADHPLLAVAAGTGAVLMARLREGRANTARGAAHFLRETVGSGALRRGQRAAPPCGLRQPLLWPTPWSQSGAGRRSASPSPSASARACGTHRSHTRRCLDASIPYWMDGAADVAETTWHPLRRVSPMPRRCGSSSGG